MATKTFVCDKDYTDRFVTGGATGGSGGDAHLPVGRGPTGFIYRTYAHFAHDWASVGQIIKAELHLRVAVTGHGAPGTAPYTVVRRLSSAIGTEPASGENVWTDGYKHLANYQSPIAQFNSGLNDGEDVLADITNLVELMAPATVKRRDGTPGGAQANHGLMLQGNSEGANANFNVFRSRNSANVAASRPYILLTYDPPASAPNSPTGLAPSGSVETATHFTGTFADPNSTDTLSQTNIRVYDEDGVTLLWETTVPASPAEATSGQFSVPIPALLRSGVVYVWDVRTQDQTGKWGPWLTSKISFKILNLPPSCALVMPLGTTFSSLSGVRFRGAFSDLDSGDGLGSFRIQLRATTAPGHPDWDTDTNLWDSGDVPPTLSEREDEEFDRPYGGTALAAGTYSWRARVQDKWGAWSAWAYSTVTLSQAWSPDPGDIDFLTGYSERRSPTRVVIRQIDTAAGRGPKDPPIAVIEDAANIGASKYFNAPGEFYMTLPATHPQVSVIEPWQTHYSVEYWRSDRYVPVFDGIVTDFDATDDDVIFYGMDYEGLLDRVVDQRWDAAAPGAPPPAGSKYTTETITAIITDQLTMARAKANSPVNFITVSTLDAFPEIVSLQTTFTPVSTTVFGLVESHRQGTGKRSRFWVRRKAAGGFEFLLKDDPGKDRDNLRLEYGGLVQGFRLTAFGDWSSVVHGIGRGVESLEPFYKSETAPGIDPAIWGRIEKVGVWDSIMDRNDLNRRVKQAAASAGRIGKRVALGLRVDSLLPFDGYDIGDSVPLLIQRGVVDTTRYGSGYWSILGVEWHTYPDGHTDNTLVVLPKEDGVPPDPDLIPGDEVIPGSEWEIGYVPPEEGTNTGKLYLDLTTGITWEQQPDGTWDELNVPPPVLAPIDLAAASIVNYDATGDAISKVEVTLTQPQNIPPIPDPPLTNYRGSWVAITDIALVADPPPDPPVAVWDERARLRFIPSDENSITFDSVAGGQTYFVRAQAEDFVGVVSPWTDEITVETAFDDIAPPVPGTFEVLGQVKALFATWSPSSASDLAFYQFRYKPDDGTGAAPVAGPWDEPLRVRTSTVYVGGLDPTPDQYRRYWCQVRAIDRAGNVFDISILPDGGAVNFADPANVDVGWTDLAFADVTLVESTDIGEGAILPQHIDHLSADLLTSGTLHINTTVEGVADGIIVYADDGVTVIGRWDEDGLYLISGGDPRDKVLLTDEGLTVFVDDVPVTVLDQSGLNADSIGTGTLPGGMNLLVNSDFEMGEFSVLTTAEYEWTSSTQWGTTRVGSDTNATTGTSIQQTNATF